MYINNVCVCVNVSVCLCIEKEKNVELYTLHAKKHCGLICPQCIVDKGLCTMNVPK